MAIGLGSQVTVLDRDLDVLDRLSRRFGAELETVYSTNDSLEAEVLAADLVVGAVLVKGADSMNWWEACVLFLMYIGYVTIMFFNEKLETFFTKLFKMEKNAKVRAVAPPLA